MSTIAAYARKEKLNLEQLAKRLECSKGHACDLNSGKAPVSPKLARRMEKLTGVPWWRWMDGSIAKAVSAR